MKSIFKKYRTFRTPIQKKEFRKQLMLGLISGVLMGLSFPPVPAPYLIFIGLIPYLYVINKRVGLADINRFTYFTFFFFNLITLYWVGSWTKDADPFLMIAGTTLMFFNPCLFLIPSTLYYFVKKRFGSVQALILLPVFWVFYEYIYTVTDFRFPWLTLANGISQFTSFIQIADIIGAYGLSLIILFVNVFLFLAFSDYRKNKKINYKSLVMALLLILLPLIYGKIKIDSYTGSGRTIKAGLIQPNLNPWKKWEAGNLNDQLSSYLDLSQKAVSNGAELIVWPESALPVYLLTGSYNREVNRIHKFLDSNNVYLLTGMPDATFYFDSTKAPADAKKTERGTFYTSYNSILFFSPNTDEVQKYGKIMLVPFGEKVPLVEHIPILGDIIKWEVGISSWNTGKEIKTFELRDSTMIGGVICIESIYPDFCSRFVLKGAQLMAIVTNDSWYGNSSGPYQHKSFAALRAVENRRSVVRAANGGVSCLIDPAGRTYSETKMFTRDYVVVDIPLNSELTIYTRHPLLIPLAATLITLVYLFIIIIEKFYNRKPLKKKLA